MENERIMNAYLKFVPNQDVFPNKAMPDLGELQEVVPETRGGWHSWGGAVVRSAWVHASEPPVDQGRENHEIQSMM